MNRAIFGSLWLAATMACGPIPNAELSGRALPFAIRAASDQNRLLIVELSAEWCKPCQVFARQVLSDPRVQEALRDVVFVRYDIDTPAGRDAMYRCRARGVPAVFGIHHDGFVRMRTLGAEPAADEFLAFLRQARTVLGTPADPAAARTR